MHDPRKICDPHKWTDQHDIHAHMTYLDQVNYTAAWFTHGPHEICDSVTYAINMK